MSRTLGFIALIVVMAAGMFIYLQQVKSVSPGQVEGSTANPGETIDLQGVRADLLQFATAERQHLASDGHYVSLDELRSGGDTGLPKDSRANYHYSIEVGENTFTVIATYSGPAIEGVPKTIRIGPEMTISGE